MHTRKQSLQRISLIIGLTGCLILVIIGGVGLWTKRQAIQRLVEQASLPSPVPYHPVSPTSSVRTTKTPATTEATTPAPLPSEINLAVPFTVQAPHANWSEPYGELCEEASVLMAISYIRHQTIASPDAADQALLAIKTFEEQKFGYYQDTTAAEVAQIFQDYYHYSQVTVVPDPTVADIKQAVAAGRLVLVPAAGQELGNPYFQTPGPLYHMLVIKGYTNSGKFITNDPGTRHGADFLYDENVVMQAMHDWRADRHIEQGRKVVLIVG